MLDLLDMKTKLLKKIRKRALKFINPIILENSHSIILSTRYWEDRKFDNREELVKELRAALQSWERFFFDKYKDNRLSSFRKHRITYKDIYFLS